MWGVSERNRNGVTKPTNCAKMPMYCAFFHTAVAKHDKELLESMIAVNTENNKPEVFYDISAIELLKKFKVEEKLNINFFGLVNYNLQIFFKRKRTSIDVL